MHNDKDELLHQYDSEQKRDKNLEFKTLIFALLWVFVILSVVLPGIYIKNEIYYISRDITKLYEQYSSLSEEQRELKRKIEAIQFKNQILDPLFMEEEEE